MDNHQRALTIDHDLFGGSASRVQDLDLTGVAIPWDSGLLRNLRTLALYYPLSGGPSIPETSHILTNCPHLTKLCLDYACNTPASIPDVSTPLQLTSLKAVRLNLDYTSLSHLVRRIRIPNCRHFACSNKDTKVEGAPVFSSETEHMSRVIRRAVRSSGWQQLNIEFDGSRFTYDARAEPNSPKLRRLWIELWGQTYGLRQEPVSVQWILDNMLLDDPASPPLSLIVTQDREYPINPSTLLPILSRLSDKVESLTLSIGGKDGIPEPLLSYLSKPYEIVPGEFRWHFPNLRKLSFEGSMRPTRISQLMQLLVDRSTTSEDAAGTYTLPTKLQELSPVRQPGDRSQELRKLVDKICWSRYG